MNDGEVLIPVNVDDKEAQKKLQKLKRDIEKTAQAIDKTNAQHNGIVDALQNAQKEAEKTAQKVQETKDMISEGERFLSDDYKGKVSSDDYNRVKEVIEQQRAELAEQEKILAAQNKTVSGLASKEEKIRETLEHQTLQLEKQKSEAGELENTINSQAQSGAPQLQAAMDQASQSVNRGFKNILKWGFGIRSTFILIRKLKGYITESVLAFAEQDEATKQNIQGLRDSLQLLKVSFGAAFAPIINAVIPLLRKLIEWVTSAANAIARFVAVLGGKSSYKKAVAGNNAVAESYGGVSDAAEEAKKQLMGFDEINQLNGENNMNTGGGGGGGGGDGIETVEEAIDMDSFAARLALTVKDVFFNWNNLNPEQIAMKALAGLTGLGGAIMGGMIGGIPGAVIGLAAGLALGTILDATIFNMDGELSKSELAQALIDAAGFTGGAVIGFIAGGGPIGALIGAAVGLALSVQLNKTLFTTEGELKPTAFVDVLKKIFSWNPGILLGPGGYSLKVIQTIEFVWNKIKIPAWEAIKNYFQPYIDEWKKNGSEEANGVGFYIVAGVIEGIINKVKEILGDLYGFFVKPIVDEVKKLLGISSPSTVFEEIGEFMIDGLWQGIKDKMSQLITDFLGKIDELKEKAGLAVERIKDIFKFEWNLPDLKLPHIYVGRYIDVPLLGTIPDPREISVQWYKKGGIFDRPSLVGVGEAGKEAVLPLERNTGWIRELAEQLADAMESKYAGAMTGLPAMAMGGVVPPRAIGGHGMFSESDFASLGSSIAAALNGAADNRPIEITNKIYLDGRQIGSSVTKYQRNRERGIG